MQNKLLEEIKKSYLFTLKSDNSNRSSKKLKNLHALIADDLQNLLNDSNNDFVVKNESIIKGRYTDKRVDIVVKKKSKIVAGIGIKFPISNYSQNKGNYFENMLGETANIRSNNFPYFQLFILFKRMPYFKKNKEISKIEDVLDKSASKRFASWQALSEDNSLSFFHTPIKTLIMVVEPSPNFFDNFSDLNNNKEKLCEFYNKMNPEELSIFLCDFKNNAFDNTLIYNDYEKWLSKVSYLIKGFE